MLLIFVTILITIENTRFTIASSSDNCRKLNSEINILKDEYDDTGKLSRTCSGDILVSRCEGYCDSQVQPSIATSTGFFKECSCCQEDHLKERIVQLDYCYDANGVRIHSTDDARMEIKIKEPADCKCIKCKIF